MEISVQKRISYATMQSQRRNLIELEKLHMQDWITADDFYELHKKYGKEIDEYDFAKYFLDISTSNFYALSVGKIKKTQILKQEIVTEEEVEEIRKRILDETDLDFELGLTYDKIVALHTKFGGRLSLKDFAEEIFCISPHSIDIAKGNPTRLMKVFNPLGYTKKQINEVRNKILEEENLHIDDLIDLDEFNNLYEQYGNGLDIRVFGKKVLMIPNGAMNGFLRGKIKKTSILSEYKIDPEFFLELRERVIKEENLHIDDIIDNDEFIRLYNKYGMFLSENMFAEEVLDISSIGVKNMRLARTGSAILGKIEIKQKYVDELRKRIASEKKYVQNEELTLRQVKALHKKYGKILSEKQFAEYVLEISDYNSLKIGAIKRTKTFKSLPEFDYEKTRETVLKKCELYPGDFIDYETFKKIHKKYAPKSSEKVFADRVLDIEEKCFYSMKYLGGNTPLLYREPKVTDDEIKKRKKQMIMKQRMHRKDRIDYATFRSLQQKYGKNISTNDFAEKMLDISKSSLSQMKSDSSCQKQILLKTHMAEEDLDKLKKKVVIENLIYPGKNIEKEEFIALYEKYNHLLSQIEFASIILGMERQSFKNLKLGYNLSAKTLTKELKRKETFSDEEIETLKNYLAKEMTDEEIATLMNVSLRFLNVNRKSAFKNKKITMQEVIYRKARFLFLEKNSVADIKEKTGLPEDEILEIIKRIQEEEKEKKKTKEKQKRDEKKKAKYSKKQIKNILGDYIYNDRNVQIIRGYINCCIESFKNGDLKEKELKILYEAFTFVNANAVDINMFARMCISFKKYDMANRFILLNLGNDGITKDENQKIRNLQGQIRYAMRKEKAANMIYTGNTNAKYIAEYCGILEVEVLEMQKRKSEGKKDIEKDFDIVPNLPGE